MISAPSNVGGKVAEIKATGITSGVNKNAERWHLALLIGSLLVLGQKPVAS